MIADTFMLVHPGVGAQAQHMIIDKPRTPERARQYLTLFSGGVEPKAIGALNVHLHMVYVFVLKIVSSQKEGREQALSLPGLYVGVSRAN